MKEEIQKLREIGINKILKDKALKKQFIEIGSKVLGEFCLTCEHVLRDKYKQLINHQNPIDMSKSEYILKPGSVISMTSPDWMEDLTEHTMTDEKAKKLLSMNLAYLRYFEKAPNMAKLEEALKNGENPLATKKKEAAKPIEKKTPIIDINVNAAKSPEAATGKPDEPAETEPTKGMSIDGSSQESGKELNYKDELVALDNIGSKTADKIIAEYPSKEELVKAINEGQAMEFLTPGAIESLNAAYFVKE